MNEQHNGPFRFFTLLEAGRLEDPSVNSLVLSACEVEVFTDAQTLGFQFIFSELSQLVNIDLDVTGEEVNIVQTPSNKDVVG